jgi:peptidoglycan/xylan/chitin deacetylase (PgdA/CDA1 family)
MKKFKMKLLRVLFLIVLGLATAGFVAADLETWLMVNFEAAKIPIFAFHNIIPNSAQNNKDGLAYKEGDLETLLEYLVKENYWFLDTNELYNYFLTNSQPIPQERLGQKPIMLTFDDGYKSIDTIVLPMLERLENKYNKRVKVVLFIYPAVINDAKKANRYLNCEELRKGAIANYYDIQSHSFSHPRLPDLNDEKLAVELEKSQTRLRQCTEGINGNDAVASHLAYPFNDSDNRVENFTSQYYLSGYLYNDQILKLGWIENNYQVPRVAVYRNRKPDEMIKFAEFATPIAAEKRQFLGNKNFHLLLEFL